MSKERKTNPCVFCYYARMRRDICGIYCTGGFQSEAGECKHFKPWNSSETEGSNSDDQ